MNVVSHEGQWVWVEVEGQRIQLLRCVDRYTAQANALGQRDSEAVQIWEDGQGLVVRLSRSHSPGSSWTAHKWV
jgi:hypothetical protein